MEPNLAYSYTLQSGNGATTIFNFSFPYISEDHITVLVDGVETAFTFNSSSSVSVVPAPANLSVVKVKRTTPKDATPFDFSDGSVLKESDLDQFALFTLYWAQEAQDDADDAITQTDLGIWDGQARRATNFADPVADSDLVTKGFLDGGYADTLEGLVANAEGQVGLATVQAGIATTKATEAAGSAVSAAASAASSAALLDSFDDRYLGPYAVNPTLDNDGNALVIGALYTNTGANEMRVYTSIGWVAASSASVAALTTYEYVATAAQTAFSGVDANGLTLSYIPDGIVAFLNGSRLKAGVDYTATNGTLFTLLSGATLNDEVTIVAFSSFTVANTYTQVQIDAKDALAATDAVAGRVELATVAETATGTDATRAVTPAGLAGSSRIVSGTVVAATSGTSIDFTGIPSWVKRITVMLNEVSTSGASPWLVQIGPSGAPETSGYTSTTSRLGGASVETIGTAGFGINVISAAATISGNMVLTNLSGLVWTSTSTFGNFAQGLTVLGGGAKTLASTLARVRLTTVGGTDTFDAGSVNILYE